MTNLPEIVLWTLLSGFVFNMAEANTLIALMGLNKDFETENGFFDDEEDIVVFSCLSTFMRRNLNRIEGFNEGIIPRYLPSEPQSHFPKTKSAMEIICREIVNTGRIPLGNAWGRQPILPEKQVHLFVWCMANQECARLVADRFNVTLSSVDRVLHRAAQALLDLCPTYIKWPNEQKRDVIMGVIEERGFPGIVGVIDGTHVKIRTPMEDPEAYINRKKFHSIQVQVICDDNMVFNDISAGWPGSVHDSRVLRNSVNVNQAAIKFLANTHLLGDGGYPLLTWIMIPYRDNGHLIARETRFNTVLSSLRQIVERAIRVLKGRWRKLQHMDHLNVELIVQLITSACVLHNICLLHDDFDPGYMLDDDDGDGDDDEDGDGDGRRRINGGPAGLKRDHLKNVIFARRILA